MSVLSVSAWAQSATVNYVTEIVTTYGGYWRSGDGTTDATTGFKSAALSTVKPDNSHDLLSFVVAGKSYSTGVNDALLISRGLSFSPGQYRALPTAALGAPTPNTKVGWGQLYDQVDNGPAPTLPSNDRLPQYLTDGANGLDLGTCVANIPAGKVTFNVSAVTSATINDGIPDILVTQVADPSGSADSYQFLDADDKVVGNSVTVTFVNIPVVGNWVADFYEASQNPMGLTSGFTKTQRDLRLWAADFSQFGITQSNYTAIKKFQIILAGSSDVAFAAYNSQSVTVLPVVLTSFTGNALANGQVRLQWQTASEVNSDAFVVEASTDGQTFAPVGRVAAAGDKVSASNYSYLHRPATTGLVYYRLHQLDHDGTSAYSPVVAVNQRGKASLLVQVAPNPFSETLRLQLPTAATGEVQLLSLEGRVVQQHTLTSAELSAGTCTLGGLSTLQPGMYLLQSILDGQRATQKVVKQ